MRKDYNFNQDFNTIMEDIKRRKKEILFKLEDIEDSKIVSTIELENIIIKERAKVLKKKQSYKEEKYIKIVEYMLDTNSSIRETAKHFSMSKSNIHNIIKSNIITNNNELYPRLRELLKNNFKRKHLKGGASTKIKYKNNIKGEE